ncbi:MAG: helix-turn-helix transcriptional regulator [Clostridia bacterium]|nr:helix-turn-helix transcriptional regulator [Clostridia bacterium]
MSDFVKLPVRRDIQVDYLVTVHYFEYSKDFEFDPERHDFWELVYMDKGEGTVFSDDVRYSLRQGELFIHKPNELHATYANGVVAPNIVIVSFGCDSPVMDFFKSNQRLTVNDAERAILADIVRESQRTFSTPLGDPYTKGLEVAEDAPVGGEQSVVNLLEQLLVRLHRRLNADERDVRLHSSVRLRVENEIVQRIIDYMRENIGNSLSFAQVCHFSAQSSTTLKTMFKSSTGLGVMEYYRLLKIDEAKRMMREGSRNITQIADQLGYTSVHYFSRHFKQVTGMNASEYLLSIQAK